MVEWDTHTDALKRGLEQAIEIDNVIRKTAASTSPDTLILFAADHSFDIRVRGGKPGQPVIPDEPPADKAAKPAIRVENGHTGEQVLVAAQGPGSQRVHGFIANADIFRIMMAAYGWKPAAPKAPAAKAAAKAATAQ
jgi:alkaline phosphatase